ncbi:hypothetical protein EC957_011961 [Mortierella hygrophila]|uniref:Protein SQS1 n=1 Tax=Mortierella hygrophila TaxID=979708 RepID=A0A9P6FH33_9FUNG|nr:hypothetical protein EC957_011961 [Mortierella hygrophila]
MVTKVAEEVEAEIQEDSIHGMIEDMDIGLEEVVEEEEAGVVAVEVDEEENELSAGELKSRSTIKRRDLEKEKFTGGYKCQRTLSGDDQIGAAEAVRNLDLDLDLDREDRREDGEEDEVGVRLPSYMDYDDDEDEEDERGGMDYDVDGMSSSGDEDDGSSDYDEDDDGEIGDPDEGLDSDEVDESEDQFIMQRFDWEDDQDPDRERKLERARRAAEAAAAAARAAKPFIPPARWGGTLAYQSAARGDDDESSGDEFEEARRLVRETLVSKTTNGVKDADQITENSRMKAATASATATTIVLNDRTTTTTTTTAKSQSVDTHVSKKSKVVVDLTEEIQAKIVEQVEEPQTIDLTAVEESTVVTGAMDVTAGVGAEAESEPDFQMLWVIDTEPSAIVPEEEPLPQIQETYINLPPEPEFTGRPAKKSHRSKRGGKKLREADQERKQIKALSEAGDGHIALDEVESEVDDDMLALEDYLQNTTDPDNPDYFDSFLGSLTSLPSGFGQSSDVRDGLDADDSDFEEDASEDDSQDDEDFDFTAKSSERRRKRKADELLSGALDTAFDSDWPAGAPYGYDFYDPEEFVGRNGRRPRGGTAAAVPYGNHLEALTSINDHIKEFVNNRSKVSLELPPLAKALRRRVHLLCEQYNLRSQSVGSGKNRFPVLLRTEKTKMPQVPIDLRKFMNAGFGPRVQAEFDNRWDRKKGGGGNHRRDGKRGGGHGNDNNKDPKDSARAVTGSVVGGTASEISKENVGHRMLAKMGWSPGVGLGASGDGITKPIEAVVRAKRRGLGHE